MEFRLTKRQRDFLRMWRSKHKCYEPVEEPYASQFRITFALDENDPTVFIYCLYCNQRLELTEFFD